MQNFGYLREQKEIFRWKKTFLIVFQGLSFGEKLKSSGHKRKQVFPNFDVASAKAADVWPVWQYSFQMKTLLPFFECVKITWIKTKSMNWLLKN